MAGNLRVGIIGANPERGWATTAHLPALDALDGIELTAVSTTRMESATETAKAHGATHAFDNAEALATCDEVDVVVVTVKVPNHYELVKTALGAGKHVFCEWPLGANSKQAEELTALALEKGVHHVVGLQGRKSPMLNYVRHLVTDGYVGRVLSVSLSLASAGRGGTSVAADRVWAADKNNGATLLTITAGHSLDALRYCVGEFAEVQAIVATLDPVATIVGTTEKIDVTAPDNVVLNGRLGSGALVSAHFLSAPKGAGMKLSILGDAGALSVTGPGSPHLADSSLALFGATGSADIAPLEVPASYESAPAAVPEGAARNVASLYLMLADAIDHGAPVDPSFETALSLHGLIDAIETSSSKGTTERL